VAKVRLKFAELHFFHYGTSKIGVRLKFRCGLISDKYGTYIKTFRNNILYIITVALSISGEQPLSSPS